MQFATVNGVTLHYRTVGDERRNPLIAFVNSLGTDFRIWDEVVSRLANDFSFLLYDKRGHGLSDIGTTPYTMEDHAADLAALLDHVGARNMIVCGISVGGQIALALSRRRPKLVRGLVLCDTGHRIGDRASWDARIAAIETGGIASVADTIIARWFSSSYATENRAAFQGYRNMLCRQPVSGYLATCAAIREADLTEAARNVLCPALCLVGEADLSTPPALVRSLTYLIHGARYETIAGAGHLPCIERPAVVAGHLRAFAAELETESLAHVRH